MSEEETDSCQEDGLHTRAASIEKHSLHIKIEELCTQLFTVYTKMVGSFIRFICITQLVSAIAIAIADQILL